MGVEPTRGKPSQDFKSGASVSSLRSPLGRITPLPQTDRQHPEVFRICPFVGYLSKYSWKYSRPRRGKEDASAKCLLGRITVPGSSAAAGLGSEGRLHQSQTSQENVLNPPRLQGSQLESFLWFSDDKSRSPNTCQRIGAIGGFSPPQRLLWLERDLRCSQTGS